MVYTIISIVALLISGACYSKVVIADGFDIFPSVGMPELLKLHNCTIPPSSWPWWIPNGANEAQAILCFFFFLTSCPLCQ